MTRSSLHEKLKKRARRNPRRTGVLLVCLVCWVALFALLPFAPEPHPTMSLALVAGLISLMFLTSGSMLALTWEGVECS